MRLVVVSLVLLNIGYFLWHFRHEPAQPAATRMQVESEPGEALVLLSEMGDDERNTELMEVMDNPMVNDGQEDQQCEAIGPFEDVLSGQQVLERLQAIDLELLLRAIDEPTGEYDYRVMIPPATSLEEAFRKLRELQSQDIDSYVMTKGKEALAISLGVYSTVDAAETAQAGHAREGYDSIVAEIERLDRSFWIVNQDMQALDVPEELLGGLQAEFPYLHVASMVCPER
jgi:hypothetical protein